ISPDSVVLQIATLSDCETAVERGYQAMWLGALVDNGPAAAEARGVQWIGCSWNDAKLDGTYVADAHSRGIEVCVYGVNDFTQLAPVLGYGVDAVTSPDPVWVSGQAPIYRRDQFHLREPASGHV